jgi:hypothetical protein
VLLALVSWVGFIGSETADEVSFPELRTATSAATNESEASEPRAVPTPEIPAPVGTPIDVSAILPTVAPPSVLEPGQTPNLLDAVADPNTTPGPATNDFLSPAGENLLP